IGVVGFSAGGHLASCAATLFDDPEGKTGAELDKVSARPDFVGLLYPVITMKDPYVHAGSRQQLLGSNPKPELVEKMSTEDRVTKDDPPIFIAQAEDDRTVPVENSIMFYQAMKKAGVPGELHLYEKGGHGFGMHGTSGEASTWINRFEEWMR